MNISKNITIAIFIILVAILSINFYTFVSFTKLAEFDVSSYTNNGNNEDKRYCVDSFKNNANSIYITGWTFVTNREYVLFENKLVIFNIDTGKYYLGNITCTKREDVSKVFSDTDHLRNYDNSGFTGAFFKSRSKLLGNNKIFIAYNDGEVKRLIDLNVKFEIK